MPIYMDVHIVPGVKARDVAEAHTKDLLHQGEYGCKCMTYWIDEKRDTIFCLIEAPEKDAVAEMHRNAHGLIPNKIIEVSSSVVNSFLGRIYDPEEAEVTSEGFKIFSDPSFRILLVTKTTDPVLLQHKLGAERARHLLNKHNDIIRNNIAEYGGTEAQHAGTGFVISFSSAANAVSCALAIQEEISAEEAEEMGLRVSLNGGEPIEKSNKLFGDTIQHAEHLCAIAKYFQVALSSTVRELVAKERLYQKNNIVCLSPQDEKDLQSIFSILEEHWQDDSFTIDHFCQAMATSSSQLYRRTVALTGFSPNQLLKEFRLERAKDLLKKGGFTISQITFDAGFSSPSYFTKCFKKKYGLLPMTYMELANQ